MASQYITSDQRCSAFRTKLLILFVTLPAFALSPAEESKVKEVAREYIADQLLAPATAVFVKETICAPTGKADFEEAKGTGPTPECKPQPADKVGDGPASIVYRASVDAQNANGVPIRSKFQLQIFFVKGKWTVRDSAAAVRLMRDACLDLNAASERIRDGRPIRDCDAEFPNAR